MFKTTMTYNTARIKREQPGSAILFYNMTFGVL